MKHGLITEIAKAAGLSVKTVHHYCSGRRRPRYENATKLHRVSGVDVLTWMKGRPDELQAALEKANP